MLTITYAKWGTRVPDEDVETWVRERIDRYLKKPQKVESTISIKNDDCDMNLTVANEIVILCLRALVCEGVIPGDQVKIIHGDRWSLLDKNGRICDSSFWVDSISDDFLNRLLGI